ncbi:hypothetical protein [Amycolatopsis sp. lyj-112]|uniref:hypothetical protein n=1 Tax=Amycolatopsis sp. lyj-112 TaxID=2789288 RepID=UPI003977F6F4
MTVYAFDETRRLLICTWDTGLGCVAAGVAELPLTATREDALRLADTLTGLSRQLWRTYTHPAGATDSLEVNTEGWRRQGEHDAFGTVIQALKEPNLPKDGYLTQSYIRVEEAAHRVGRALHKFDDAALAEQVIADVEAELGAVEHAERGDLSERAKQAVMLTRADASPLQVNAAHDLFREQPIGSEKLLHEVDPTAAAVAAAHWLQAAATISAGLMECDPSEVVVAADELEALAVETPTRVLERLGSGETPRDVVLDLIRTAMTAAEGRIADTTSLPDQARISLLDPLRPAHDLLEDLLDGIHGCRLLFHEYSEYDDDPEELAERLDVEFEAAVRAEAEANQDRLR